MTRKSYLAFMLAVAWSTSAQTQELRAEPQGVRLVEYLLDEVVRIDADPGFQTAIEIAPDEVVQTVALGDTGAWQVTVDKAGGRLFVKPIQAGAATNMTVVTNARRYVFQLGGGGGAPSHVVRFRYAAPGEAGSAAEEAIVGRYRLSGAKALRPVAIHDDGVRTYVEWPADAPLPAVFVRDPLGREQVANGAMRGSRYVIDSVSDRLIFKVDRHEARATRRPEGSQ